MIWIMLHATDSTETQVRPGVFELPWDGQVRNRWAEDLVGDRMDLKIRHNALVRPVAAILETCKADRGGTRDEDSRHASD